MSQEADKIKFPLVSVGVITYNQEHFIEQTLQSIVTQDYPNLEILVGDDCSTDASRQKILAFAEKNTAVKPLFPDKNQGITGNSNLVLKNAKGRFFILFGGDDLMKPGRIRKQVELLQQNPQAAICCTDIEVFYDGDSKESHIYRNKVFYKNSGPAKVIAQENAPPTSALMFDLDKGGDITFDMRTPVVSDWLYVVEYALAGSIVYVPEVYTKYRRHAENSTSRGIEKSYLDDRLIYTDIFIAKYQKYFFSYKQQRSSIFFNAAKRHYKAGSFKGCRNLLIKAASEWPFSYKNYALFLLSLLGKRFVKHF